LEGLGKLKKSSGSWGIEFVTLINDTNCVSKMLIMIWGVKRYYKVLKLKKNHVSYIFLSPGKVETGYYIHVQNNF
jgi:hypothetical protein